MTVLAFACISFAGGLGASCRMLLDGFINTRIPGALPWGTIVINVTGSLLLGLIVGLTTSSVLPTSWQLVTGSGFLGGYTTFSTASVETVRLAGERAWVLALINGFGTLIITTAAAGLGLWLGAWG